jgi:hypothetical protein
LISQNNHSLAPLLGSNAFTFSLPIWTIPRFTNPLIGIRNSSCFFWIDITTLHTSCPHDSGKIRKLSAGATIEWKKWILGSLAP